MCSVATANATFVNNQVVIAGIYPGVETAWETITDAIETGLEKTFGYSLEEALKVGLVKCIENKLYRWVGLMPDVEAQCSPEVAEKFEGVWGFGFIDYHVPQGTFKVPFSDRGDGAYVLQVIEEVQTVI